MIKKLLNIIILFFCLAFSHSLWANIYKAVKVKQSSFIDCGQSNEDLSEQQKKAIETCREGFSAQGDLLLKEAVTEGIKKCQANLGSNALIFNELSLSDRSKLSDFKEAYAGSEKYRFDVRLKNGISNVVMIQKEIQFCDPSGTSWGVERRSCYVVLKLYCDFLMNK